MSKHIGVPRALFHTPDSPKVLPGWDVQQNVARAAIFFESATPLAASVADYLYYFRMADDGVFPDITTLAICSYIDGLVNSLFDYFELENTFTDSEIEEFKKAQADMVENLTYMVAVGNKDYQRCLNIMRKASPFYFHQKFKAVITRLGIKWDAHMKDALAIWDKVRNSAAHGRLSSWDSDEEQRERWNNEAEIAGIFNLIALKVCGYSGKFRGSDLALAENYRDI